jgi:hypothetical protein
MFQTLWVMLLGGIKMALMMLQVSVPQRADLILKTVMATAMMMYALGAEDEEGHGHRDAERGEDTRLLNSFCEEKHKPSSLAIPGLYVIKTPKPV